MARSKVVSKHLLPIIRPTNSKPGNLRTVRSYVVRGGRTTLSQERAITELGGRYGIDFQPAMLGLKAVFGRTAPLTIEIGFGNGEHLLARAQAEPERLFLGIEVHRAGIGAVLLRAAASNLQNLRVIRHDAVEVLAQQIPAGAVDELEILFPDPWHKARHHKRRLIQPAFAALVASRLRPGGSLHLATDWLAYAEQMLEVLSGCEGLENTVPSAAFAPRDTARAATRFERRGERLGHNVYELRWQRVIAASR
jgi:tRNA (guanine-N7-)-methyltransferase